jgi:hypothetical protein
VPGTRTPLADSWLIISPRLAFLPPTTSTSVILRFFETGRPGRSAIDACAMESSSDAKNRCDRMRELHGRRRLSAAGGAWTSCSGPVEAHA